MDQNQRMIWVGGICGVIGTLLQSQGSVMSKMGQSFFPQGTILIGRRQGFDVGPVAALWLLVVYIQMVRAAMKEDPVTVQRSGSEKV